MTVTLALALLIFVPNANAALLSYDHAHFCQLLLATNRFPTTRPETRESLHHALTQVFGAGFWEEDISGAKASNRDEVTVDTPSNVPSEDLVRLARAVRDPDAQVYRTEGDAIKPEFYYLNTYGRRFSDPDKRMRRVGLVPAVVGGLGVFAQLPHTHLGIFGELATEGSIVVYMLSAFAYWKHADFRWVPKHLKLLKSFEDQKDLARVALSQFSLNLEKEDVEKWTNVHGSQPTTYTIKRSPTENGYLQFVGETLKRLVNQPPMRRLDFWTLLYFDAERGVPVFLYGLPN